MSRTPIPPDLILDESKEPTYTEFLESRLALIRNVMHNWTLSQDEQLAKVDALIFECVEAKKRSGT